MGREEVGISKGLSGSSLRYRRYTGADNILPYSCEEHDRMKCCGCATRREHGLKEIIDGDEILLEDGRVYIKESRLSCL